MREKKQKSIEAARVADMRQFATEHMPMNGGSQLRSQLIINFRKTFFEKFKTQQEQLQALEKLQRIVPPTRRYGSGFEVKKHTKAVELRHAACVFEFEIQSTICNWKRFLTKNRDMIPETLKVPDPTVAGAIINGAPDALHGAAAQSIRAAHGSSSIRDAHIASASAAAAVSRLNPYQRHQASVSGSSGMPFHFQQQQPFTSPPASMSMQPGMKVEAVGGFSLNPTVEWLGHSLESYSPIPDSGRIVTTAVKQRRHAFFSRVVQLTHPILLRKCDWKDYLLFLWLK